MENESTIGGYVWQHKHGVACYSDIDAEIEHAEVLQYKVLCEEKSDDSNMIVYKYTHYLLQKLRLFKDIEVFTAGLAKEPEVSDGCSD
jgi:hypothetical protein